MAVEQQQSYKAVLQRLIFKNTLLSVPTNTFLREKKTPEFWQVAKMSCKRKESEVDGCLMFDTKINILLLII